MHARALTCCMAWPWFDLFFKVWGGRANLAGQNGTETCGRGQTLLRCRFCVVEARPLIFDRHFLEAESSRLVFVRFFISGQEHRVNLTQTERQKRYVWAWIEGHQGHFPGGALCGNPSPIYLKNVDGHTRPLRVRHSHSLGGPFRCPLFLIGGACEVRTFGRCNW